jgi:4-hydroxy-3-polyprenylbenzoate decarboxylase
MASLPLQSLAEYSRFVAETLQHPCVLHSTVRVWSDSPFTGIVGIPPMEDFYIGGASVKLFLPIFKMNFPEIVDIALPAEGVFHNLVFVSIRKTYPMQAYKIMHGLWGMGQMMFTKYLVVVDDDVDMHNTSEVLFRLCANTDPQRDSIFTKGPSDVLDHATSEIASGSKLGIDATKKLPGEGFKRPWPPLIKMDEAVKAKVEKLFQSNPTRSTL